MYSSKIICPKCGREYLAGEIFIPKEFIGRPTLIERDTFGKVIFSNDDLDLKEEYVCDKCGSKLQIKAKVAFETQLKENYKDDYRQKIR